MVVIGDVRCIHLGPGSYIGYGCVINTRNDGGLADSRLDVGTGTYIGEYNNLRCAGQVLTIGARCLISQHVTIVGSNHGTAAGEPIQDQAWVGGGVVIGDDVWVGAGAVLLPGVHVGRGAVIAAGSVVTRSVEPDSVVAGVPARPHGART